jgi:hypothetical protein
MWTPPISVEKATVLRVCVVDAKWMMRERTVMSVKEISSGSQGVLQKQHPYWLLLSSAIKLVPRHTVMEPIAYVGSQTMMFV